MELVECLFQLVASPADVFLRSLDDKGGVIVNQFAGFVSELGVNAHGSRENQPFGFLPAIAQTANNELGVEPGAHGGSPEVYIT
jgi:hypothetical protein